MNNNDMIGLFPDVINQMQISSLDIKKMYILPFLPSDCLLTVQVFPISGELCSFKAGHRHEGFAHIG